MANPVPGAVAARANGNSTSHLVDAPAGIVAGQLMVMQVRFSAFTVPFVDTDGWTIEDEQDGGGGSTKLLTKVADATDVALAGTAGAYTLTTSASGQSTPAVFLIEDHAGIETVTGFNEGANSDTTMTLPSVTTLGPNRAIFWFAGTRTAADYTWDRQLLNANEIYETPGTPNRSSAATWEEQAAQGASGTRVVTTSVADRSSGHVLVVVPGAGIGGAQVSAASTAAAVSSATATPRVQKRVSSTAAAASTAAGVAKAQRGVSGTAAAASSATAEPETLRGVQGAAAAVSSASAVASQQGLEAVREGFGHNLEHGRNTQSRLGRGMGRFEGRRLMGGPALSRAR